jgi:PAS domain-containing protein
MMPHLRRAEAARGGNLRQLYQQRPGLGVLAAQIIALATDITSRRRAQQELRAVEAQLRLMIDYSPAAVAKFDRDMRYAA